MSEFGRTARQNGTGGTDHGHANVMFVLGGEVKGGKVYGKWPGIANEQLNEGRDLAVTTDFRNVLGEAAYKTLGSRNLDVVFPGSQVRPGSVPQLHLAGRAIRMTRDSLPRSPRFRFAGDGLQPIRRPRQINRGFGRSGNARQPSPILAAILRTQFCGSQR